jgi:hypothetical protein
VDTIGSVVAPGVAAQIPGSTLNNEVQENRANRQETQDIENRQREASTAKTQADTQTELNPQPSDKTPIENAYKSLKGQINPDTGKPYSDYEAYEKVATAAQKPTTPPKPEEAAFNSLMGQTNPTTGRPYTATEAYQAIQRQPKPDNIDQRYQDAIDRGDHATAERLLKVKRDMAAAGQAPERPEKPQRVLMMVPQPDGSQKAVEVTPGMTIAGNAEKPGESASANRKDIATHDKAYVQPAEAVEKSYQMMDQAYKDYEAAKAQGKELPTGAQSMLALSTHLSTTFGNVKGARITKDMIQEHLGARSVSDTATVAIQKLTNGDTLSPAQWTAFHDLVKQSRDLSWQTAVKEAERKKIPVDFLPQDLQGKMGAGARGKAPAVGTVEGGYRFKGGDPSKQSGWEKAGQ